MIRPSPDKSAAYKAVARAIKEKTIVRKSCEVCGKERTDAHHDDYSKPLEIRWLCKKHHRMWHAKNSPVVRSTQSGFGFGSLLRSLRIKRGYGVREFCRLSGVGVATVVIIESGDNSNPTLDIIVKLAAGLGITAQSMIEKFESKASNVKSLLRKKRNRYSPHP